MHTGINAGTDFQTETIGQNLYDEIETGTKRNK